MATGLIPDLDDPVDERLNARASGHNRSLEAELREILVPASKQVELAAAPETRRVMEGRPCGDIGEILA